MLRCSAEQNVRVRTIATWFFVGGAIYGAVGGAVLLVFASRLARHRQRVPARTNAAARSLERLGLPTPDKVAYWRMLGGACLLAAPFILYSAWAAHHYLP